VNEEHGDQRLEVFMQELEELTPLLQASFVITYKLYDTVVDDSVSLTDGVVL